MTKRPRKPDPPLPPPAEIITPRKSPLNRAIPAALIGAATIALCVAVGNGSRSGFTAQELFNDISMTFVCWSIIIVPFAYMYYVWRGKRDASKADEPPK